MANQSAEPTREEIRKACRMIQQNWSPQEFLNRVVDDESRRLMSGWRLPVATHFKVSPELVE